MFLEEGRGAAPPLVAQVAEEGPFGIELGGIAEIDHGRTADPVQAHRGPEGALAVARIGDLAQQGDHTQFLEQRGVEGDLVLAVEDVAGRARDAGALDRIDLDQDGVVRTGFTHQRGNGGIAGEAAIPIGLTVDLDGLEHHGETGRGEQGVGGQVGIAEHARAAGAHAGGGGEHLDRRLGQSGEVDGLGQDIPQRVEVAGIEVIGGEQARGQVAEDEGRRVVHRPLAQQHVDWTATQRAQQGRIRGQLPEAFQGDPGALGATRGIAVAQDRGIHGPGGGTGESVDAEPGLLQEPVQHPPGEGAVGPPTLQGEVHGHQVAGTTCGRLLSRSGFVHGYSALDGWLESIVAVPQAPGAIGSHQGLDRNPGLRCARRA